MKMGCRDAINLTYTKVKRYNLLFCNKGYFVVFEEK